MTAGQEALQPAADADQSAGSTRRDSAVFSSDSRSERRFALAVTALFLAVVIPVAVHHEMWRDEIQSWLLARDTSMHGLFDALHYEGHPALWYLTLKLFTPFTAAPQVIQWISTGLGAATVYLFASRAPLPRVVRALFAFGYFVAYGYTVVARSYALEMFVIMVLCVTATRRPSQRSAVCYGIAILLLANISIYGVMIVLALVAAMFCVALFNPPNSAQPGAVSRPSAQGSGTTVRERLRPIVIPVAFAILGVTLALAQVWPRPNAPYHGNGAVTRAESGLPAAHYSFGYRLSPMWRAFVPIPPLDELGDVWEGDMLLHRSPRAEPVAGALSVCIVVVLMAVLWRSPVAATFFGFATLGILLFSMLIFSGSLYHHGHFFLAFVMALWIAGADPGWRVPRRNEPRVIRWAARHRMAIVNAMLLVQIGGAAIRMIDDYRYPFSEGKAVADFLKAHAQANTVVVAEPGFKGTTVSGYLGRPVYQLDRDMFATYTPLSMRWPPIPDSLMVAAVRECCVHGDRPVVLVLDHALPDSVPGAPLLAAFTESMQPSERFHLYSIGPGAVAARVR